MSTSRKTAHFIVIGTPGHGKSTFLNEIAGEPLFKVSSAGMSCTQLGTDEEGNSWEAMNDRVIKLKADDGEYDLHVVDTPGFPDPDRAKAKDYYNHVVQKCNSKINGVVFLVRPERLCMDLIERYSTMLREFSFLDVPLIILVNGFERGKRDKESDEKYKKRRDEGAASFRKTAEEIARAGQLQPRDIFVSYTLDEIERFGTDIAKILALEEPRVSKLRTYEQVKEDLERAEESDEAAKQEEIRLEQAKRKQAERNIAHNECVEKQMLELSNGRGLDQVDGLVHLLYGLAACVGAETPCKALAAEAAAKVTELKQEIDRIDRNIEHIGNYTAEELLELRERVRQLTRHLVG